MYGEIDCSGMSIRTRKGFVRTMVATFMLVEMNSPEVRRTVSDVAADGRVDGHVAHALRDCAT